MIIFRHKKTPLKVEFLFCGREGSNLHGIATTGSLILRVCQFRHARNILVIIVTTRITIPEIIMLCNIFLNVF